jgi:hypothetical protein
MAKITLPHLTPQEIKGRDHEENELSRMLSQCWHGNDFDSERAHKCLLGHGVEIFKYLHAVYRSRAAFEDSWFPEIKHEAIHRTMTVYSGFNVHGMPSTSDLLKDLSGAIDSEKPLSKVLMSAPKNYPLLSGNVSSPPPPLLSMAMNTLHRLTYNPVSETRKRFVQPLLDKKGWSVPEWAEKAKVTRHTAKSYLEANRKTTHYNIKKLAEALGVSFEQFPK